MIGNDVVDLRHAKHAYDWRRPRYLQKLFTLEEQAAIREADDPDQLVWVYWSMKESAYKVIARTQGRRFFAPKRFRCCLHDVPHNDNTLPISGSVCFEDHCFETNSFVQADSIHTIAHSRGISYRAECFMLPHNQYEKQHKATYARLLEGYAACLDKSYVPTRRSIPSGGFTIHSTSRPRGFAIRVGLNERVCTLRRLKKRCKRNH